jgi:hypothetical protein
MNAKLEREALWKAWPDAFDDGARCGAGLKIGGPREPGGYPMGFRGWPLERRNAWFSGWNFGNAKRALHSGEVAEA